MSTHSTETPKDRAVLVGLLLLGMTGAEVQSSLDELERLASTLGLVTVGRLTQARPSSQANVVLGPGKLRELASWTGGKGTVPGGAAKRTSGSLPKGDDGAGGARMSDDEDDDAGVDEPETDEDDVDAADEAPKAPGIETRADVVIFDHDLSPRQLRNLEAATGAEVHDRSSIILAIFQRHARTREARLQVEIARLVYMAPRLRATGGSGERQRGGIGGKGAGESAMELDRRRVRDRIAELRAELVAVQGEADSRRSRRSDRNTAALVGYTNAGKSSWMRALTGSEVLVRDQLFATLDTTVRLLTPRTRPPVLISDTVGFIKKLPHDLVASFRSTLEEARDASLVIYVVDASDPAWRAQLDVTRTVLREIGAHEAPTYLVLNKADRLSEEQRAEALALVPSLSGDGGREPDEVHLLSAHNPDDVATLHERIEAFFERDMIEDTLLVPYHHGKLVHAIHEECRVFSESYEEDGTLMRVKTTPAVFAAFREAIAAR